MMSPIAFDPAPCWSKAEQAARDDLDALLKAKEADPTIDSSNDYEASIRDPKYVSEGFRHLVQTIVINEMSRLDLFGPHGVVVKGPSAEVLLPDDSPNLRAAVVSALANPG